MGVSGAGIGALAPYLGVIMWANVMWEGYHDAEHTVSTAATSLMQKCFEVESGLHGSNNGEWLMDRAVVGRCQIVLALRMVA